MPPKGVEEWDESARKYDSYEKKWNYYGTVADELARQLPLKKNSRVLELASGTGACTTRLAKLVPMGTVTCLDFSERMIEVARENVASAGLTNVEFLRGEAGDVSSLLAGRRFDIAASNSAFFHFPEPDRVLDDLKGLLTGGGVFGLSVPEPRVSAGGDLSQQRANLVQVLQKHGGTPEEVRSVYSSGVIQAMDYPALFKRHGYSLAMSKFEFRVSLESRREWRMIGIFSQGSALNQFVAGLDLRTRADLRDAISSWAKARRRDAKVSRWRIMVAQINGKAVSA